MLPSSKQLSHNRVEALSLKAALTVVVLLAAACTGQATGAPSSKPQSVSGTTTGTTPSGGSATATGDPRVIVDALDAAGLALCHADYSDGAQYDIFGILGATATWRFFPHHSAVPVPAATTANGPALSCVTPNQPNTGVIEVDVYPSAVDASAVLRQVGHIWLDAWLYGNVAVLIDQTTPGPIAQEVREVLDRLPGTTQFP
jgi:hypothetical protein